MDYKWDLTRIFKDEEDYNKSIAEVNKLLVDIVSFKGRILESDKTLLELLTLETKIDKLLSKIYVYSYLGFYDNMGDVKFQEYKENASSLMVKAGSVTSFIVPEVLSSEYTALSHKDAVSAVCGQISIPPEGGDASALELHA